MEHDFVVRARGPGSMPSGLLGDTGEVLLGTLNEGAGGDGGGGDGGAGGAAAAVSRGDAGLREVRRLGGGVLGVLTFGALIDDASTERRRRSILLPMWRSERAAW